MRGAAKTGRPRHCKIINLSSSSRINLIVPVAVKVTASQRQALHVGLRDLDSGGIAILVQPRLDAEPLAGSCASDEVDDRLEARQGLSSPVLRDVAEEPVFDLIPLARTRWEVADMDTKACLVGQILEFDFPR